MNVSCPQCSTVYRVDPAKVPQGGVRARCSTCGGVIPVGIAAPQPTRRPTPAASDAVGDAFAPRRTPPGPFVPPQRQKTPAAPSRPVTPISSPRVTPAAAPRVPTPPLSPRVATPAIPSPAQGASLPPLRPTPRAPMPAVNIPSAAPPRVPTPQAPQAAVSVPAETPPSPMAAAQPAAPPVSQSPQPGAPAPGARRPINPFLARDPSLRAKRLARALVSDMVAYYPAKHAEGLEKGTLKELFRDEIKKSYEEYVQQVGADFARSTTHFQESLNEVLGAGRKIF